jgi:uncharacterized damage-inducible protein DinB
MRVAIFGCLGLGVMAERDELLASLREQQSELIDKFESLTESEARQVVAPSGWCALDLAYHVSTGHEFWIGAIARGDEVTFDLDDPLGSWAWATPENLTLAEAIENYRAACRSSEMYIAEVPSLDDAPARQPVWEFTRHWSRSLRTVVLHLIDETARHAGHMDLVCELLRGPDGAPTEADAAS